MKILLISSLIGVIQLGHVLSSNEMECSWKSEVMFGQFVKSIHLQHSASVSFTWDWMKGTSNITVNYTTDINITHSMDGKGTLKLVAVENQSSGCSRLSGYRTRTVVAFAIVMFCSALLSNGKHALVILVFSLFVLVSCDTNNACIKPRIHITIPIEYLRTICVKDNKCFPVKCPLSFVSKYSTIPSDDRVIFTNNYCTIKKPDGWDEWIQYHFKTNASTERYYLRDSDNDGLVNLLEFYGDTRTNHSRLRRSAVGISSIGTDPKNPDTDGDLLLDGFEIGNGMPAKIINDANGDEDSDGLSNLSEQIYGSDPTNPDTDGDGVSDGQEAKQGTGISNPIDNGQNSNDDYSASIKLTIGDPSGSNSERYSLKVGSITHQSPDFGKMGSGTYVFQPGEYQIVVRHIASNRNTPDYDYSAAVEKQSGNANVEIIDPQELLGFHHESYYDFTLGKFATLKVTAICSDSSACACRKTCQQCQKTSDCLWIGNKCAYYPAYRVAYRPYPYPSSVPTYRPECHCDSCLEWYNKEKLDTKWLEELNDKFKCPCQAKLTGGVMKEVDNPSNVEWKPDGSCTNPTSAACDEYHPGASGCLRSVAHTSVDAGQQCCYGADGKLLAAGTRGAGTPDKEHGSYYNIPFHWIVDVWPYDDCCTNCEIDSYCDFYTNGVRRGDDSHCLN